MAEQGRALALLADQPGIHQMLDVMRQGRCRDPEPVLQVAARDTVIARPHQSSEEFEADRIAEGCKLLGCYFEFHGSRMAPTGLAAKEYFDIYRISHLRGHFEGQKRSILNFLYLCF